MNKSKRANSYLQGIVKCKKCYLENSTDENRNNMLAYTYNEDKNVFLKCSKHQSNLQYVDDILDVILHTITVFLTNHLRNNFRLIYKQALNKQISILKRDIDSLHKKINDIEEKINSRKMDYLLMDASLNPIMIQKELIELGILKINTTTHLNKSLNDQSHLTQLIDEVNPTIAQCNTIEDIKNYIRSKQDNIMHDLLKTMIDFILVNNKEIVIYLNQSYIESKDNLAVSS